MKNCYWRNLIIFSCFLGISLSSWAQSFTYQCPSQWQQIAKNSESYKGIDATVANQENVTCSNTSNGLCIGMALVSNPKFNYAHIAAPDFDCLYYNGYTVIFKIKNIDHCHFVDGSSASKGQACNKSVSDCAITCDTK